MERWSDRVAVVTGATAGIGAAIAEELVKEGLRVVGLARRVEKVEIDVSKEPEVKEAFKWIKTNLGGVDILINNAGVASFNSLRDGPVEKWRKIFDLNVLGLSVCTKEALQSMKERGVDDGHIIHINSVVGHKDPNFVGIQMYSASKHAVTALTEGPRRELVQQKSKIRVTDQLRPRMQEAGHDAAALLAAPKPMEPPVVSTKSQMAMPVPAPVVNTSQNSGTVTVTVPEAAGAPAVTPWIASRQLQSNAVPENNMVQPREDVKTNVCAYCTSPASEQPRDTKLGMERHAVQPPRPRHL